jgi:hypothetical protein
MSATVTPITTATDSQKAALAWVNTRTGKRPSTPTLRLVTERGWVTPDKELTDTGRAVLGLRSGPSPEAVATAVAQLQAELTAAAPAISKALEESDAEPVKDAKPAPEFIDYVGRLVKVGDKITVSVKGNNVRKQDVGATGTVRGTTRTRLLVDWDAPDHMAPRWPVLPALVTVQV